VIVEFFCCFFVLSDSFVTFLGGIMIDDELQKIREKKLRELQKQLELKQKYPPGNVHHLDSTNFDEFIRVAPIAVIDLWAEWCRPCLAMAPVMETIAQQWGDKGVLVGKLNVDENPTISARYGVRSIPTFLVFKNGQLVQRVIGAVGKAPFDKILSRLTEQ